MPDWEKREKRSPDWEQAEQAPEGERGRVRAGKGEMDDEMLPSRGEPQPQRDEGGDVPDPGAAEGAPETARSIAERDEAARRKLRER